MFEEHILPLLTPVEDLWQPSDFLPSSQDPDQFYQEVSWGGMSASGGAEAGGEPGTSRDPPPSMYKGECLRGCCSPLPAHPAACPRPGLQITELRERAAELPDELFVCLVGDMITEEALPTYMAMLNTLDGVRDETGRSQHPYAQWTRCGRRTRRPHTACPAARPCLCCCRRCHPCLTPALPAPCRQWIAEEHRHGDALGRYLYLSGRVDMKQVERTVQRLISAGMDPRSENHPYLCFVYTSFQVCV